MNDYLKLYDLRELIEKEIEKEMIVNFEIKASSLSSALGLLSSSISKDLSHQYKDAACFFFESDHEHDMTHFLSNIESIDYKLDKKGLKIDAKINRAGRYVKDSKTFYQLVENRISQNRFNDLLKSRRRVVGSSTWHKKPIVQIVPKYDQCMSEYLFVVKDGEEIYKHRF